MKRWIIGVLFLIPAYKFNDGTSFYISGFLIGSIFTETLSKRGKGDERKMVS